MKNKIGMKKAYIIAYTAINLGDDLFIKILCNKYINTKFIILANKKYKEIFSDYKNIIILDSFYPAAINYLLKKLKIKINALKVFENILIRQCDLCIQIGGSIFIQSKDWQINNHEKKQIYIQKKPFYIINSNFGPYDDHDYYLFYKEIFSKITNISFRDKFSYNLFKDLPNTGFYDDIVFSLDYKRDNVNTEKNIGISVIELSYRQGISDFRKEYMRKIIEIVEYYSQKNYHVTLFSFCQAEGDENAVNEIISRVNKKYKSNLSPYYYRGNIDEALLKINDMESIIATRFHAMILGFVMDKPVFPFVYSDKMQHVLDDMDFKGMYINIKDISDLNVDILFANISKNRTDISQQKINANNHFLNLDQILKKGCAS